MKLYEYSINNLYDLANQELKIQEIEVRETNKLFKAVEHTHFSPYREQVSKEDVKNHNIIKGFSSRSVVYASPNLEDAIKVLSSAIEEEILKKEKEVLKKQKELLDLMMGFNLWKERVGV